MKHIITSHPKDFYIGTDCLGKETYLEWKWSKLNALAGKRTRTLSSSVKKRPQSQVQKNRIDLLHHRNNP